MCTPCTTTLATAPSSRGCSCRAEGIFCVQVGHEGVCCPSWRRRCLRSGYRPPRWMRKELCQLSATSLVSMITTELAASTSLMSLLVPRLQMHPGGAQEKGKGLKRTIARWWLSSRPVPRCWWDSGLLLRLRLILLLRGSVKVLKDRLQVLKGRPLLGLVSPALQDDIVEFAGAHVRAGHAVAPLQVANHLGVGHPWMETQPNRSYSAPWG